MYVDHEEAHLWQHLRAGAVGCIASIAADVAGAHISEYIKPVQFTKTAAGRISGSARWAFRSFIGKVKGGVRRRLQTTAGGYLGALLGPASCIFSGAQATGRLDDYWENQFNECVISELGYSLAHYNQLQEYIQGTISLCSGAKSFPADNRKPVQDILYQLDSPLQQSVSHGGIVGRFVKDSLESYGANPIDTHGHFVRDENNRHYSSVTLGWIACQGDPSDEPKYVQVVMEGDFSIDTRKYRVITALIPLPGDVYEEPTQELLWVSDESVSLEDIVSVMEDSLNRLDETQVLDWGFVEMIQQLDLMVENELSRSLNPARLDGSATQYQRQTILLEHGAQGAHSRLIFDHNGFLLLQYFQNDAWVTEWQPPTTIAADTFEFTTAGVLQLKSGAQVLWSSASVPTQVLQLDTVFLQQANLAYHVLIGVAQTQVYHYADTAVEETVSICSELHQLQITSQRRLRTQDSTVSSSTVGAMLVFAVFKGGWHIDQNVFVTETNGIIHVEQYAEAAACDQHEAAVISATGYRNGDQVLYKSASVGLATRREDGTFVSEGTGDVIFTSETGELLEHIQSTSQYNAAFVYEFQKVQDQVGLSTTCPPLSLSTYVAPIVCLLAPSRRLGAKNAKNDLTEQACDAMHAVRSGRSSGFETNYRLNGENTVVTITFNVCEEDDSGNAAETTHEAEIEYHYDTNGQILYHHVALNGDDVFLVAGGAEIQDGEIAGAVQILMAAIEPVAVVAAIQPVAVAEAVVAAIPVASRFYNAYRRDRGDSNDDVEYGLMEAFYQVSISDFLADDEDPFRLLLSTNVVSDGWGDLFSMLNTAAIIRRGFRTDELELSIAYDRNVAALPPNFNPADYGLESTPIADVTDAATEEIESLRDNNDAQLHSPIQTERIDPLETDAIVSEYGLRN